MSAIAYDTNIEKEMVNGEYVLPPFVPPPLHTNERTLLHWTSTDCDSAWVKITMRGKFLPYKRF